MTRLTRQGVRDLDGPQRNGRRVPRTATCIHVWEHDELTRVGAVDETLCFWHPVGPHAGETFDEIQTRKRREVADFGFTLWSFAPATPARVYAWRAELSRAGQQACGVVGCGEQTADPHDGKGPVTWLREYSEDLVVWKPLPSPRMTSYHRPATRHGIVASAFMVTGIAVPESQRIERPKMWFRARDQVWTNGGVPTRGEYLVRRPAPSSRGRRVRVALQLAPPFVVWLRA